VPNTESAKKRMRQDAVKHSRNLWRKRQIKDQIKSFLTAVHDHNEKTAKEEYRKTCGLLDKIAAKGTIHKNTAARRKSRLARRLIEMKQKSTKS
jgi:small subunit ribosomal protein S20